MGMKVYTVFENKEKLDPVRRHTLVKDGLYPIIILAPFLWFIYKLDWRGALAYTGLVMVLSLIFTLVGLGEELIALLLFGLQIVFAFEASRWRELVLRLEGFEPVAMVSGHSMTEAEWVFFAHHDLEAEKPDSSAPSPASPTKPAVLAQDQVRFARAYS